MRFSLLLLWFAMIPFRLWPCSCVDIRTFCETITFNTGAVNPDLIILGEKTSGNETGMAVRILEILHGAEPSATLTVLRGNGADCGENTDIFQKGEKLVLALYRDDRSPASYRLSICGVNYLRVGDDDRVTGSIAPGVDELSYAEFRKLDQCGFAPKVDLPDLNIFPNPTRDRFFLETGQLDQPMKVRLKIRDMLGRQVGGDQSIDLEEKSTREIPVGHLASGVYVLEFTAGQERRQMKVVVQR